MANYYYLDTEKGKYAVGFASREYDTKKEQFYITPSVVGSNLGTIFLDVAPVGSIVKLNYPTGWYIKLTKNELDSRYPPYGSIKVYSFYDSDNVYHGGIDAYGNNSYFFYTDGYTSGEGSFMTFGFTDSSQYPSAGRSYSCYVITRPDEDYDVVNNSSGAFSKESVLADFSVFVNGSLVVGPQDPYKPGGTSGGGGGSGSFDKTGDTISTPTLPALSSSNAGFITLYNPTLSQINSLASFMWSDAFSIDTFRRLFAEPMDAILGLSILPISVPDGGTREVKVGNISTGVSMNTAAVQYVHFSCGTLKINEYWGAYLDYSPYTEISIFLPYCGSFTLDTDDIMGKTVGVDYNIDILSGACIASITCNGTVIYQFSGNCAQQVPVTSVDWSRAISSAMSVIGGAISGAAKGGLGGAALGFAASSVQAVSNLKPEIKKSNGVAGASGFLGVQKPFLTFKFPRQCLPENQNQIIGYPSFQYVQLNKLSGMTRVENIHLVVPSATEEEKAEIESLLKEGVLL